MMKLYYLLVTIFLFTSSYAQSKISLEKDLNVVAEFNTNEKQTSRVNKYTKSQFKKLKKTAFFIEDFSNGFAGQDSNGAWTQSATPSTQTGLVPMWEYRGPATTPDNTVDSRGSCKGTRGPIESETVDNGFLIFDSNYWDEPAPDSCAGLGTGLSPRPHQSALVSPSIDMSAQTEVQLFFTTYSRNFQASVNLSVIADGDTTFIVDIYEFLDLKGNEQTATNTLVGINITDAAAGKSDVRVEFDFVGDYYYFSFDDVFFNKIPDYDYNIESVYNDDITENYEYFDLLQSQINVLAPGFQVLSRGTKPVELDLQITITEPDGEIKGPFNQTLNIFTKDSLSDNIFIPTYIPTKFGVHIIDYTISSDFDSLDFDQSNNTAQRYFRLTDDRWSDAQSNSIGYGSYAPVIDSLPGDCEQFQLYTAKEYLIVSGIDYIIYNYENRPDLNTNIFDEIELAVYEVDKSILDSSLSLNNKVSKSEAFKKIGSKIISIEPEMIQENIFYNITSTRFDVPIFINDGTTFAISLSNIGGGYLSVIATKPNQNPDRSGLIRARGLLPDPSAATDDDVFYMPNLNPWLRVVANRYNGINSNSNDVNLFVYPNPANNETTISYNLQSASNSTLLTITNLTGKVVYSATENNVSIGEHRSTIATNKLNSGMYFVTITADGRKQTQKLVINKQ